MSIVLFSLNLSARIASSNCNAWESLPPCLLSVTCISLESNLVNLVIFRNFMGLVSYLLFESCESLSSLRKRTFKLRSCYTTPAQTFLPHPLSVDAMVPRRSKNALLCEPDSPATVLEHSSSSGAEMVWHALKDAARGLCVLNWTKGHTATQRFPLFRRHGCYLNYSSQSTKQ